uniref:Uncharacterized protein n=1 Tax=Panagrolaimus superbus TaxID=310955 RepID=A0A914YBU9_9BILA
MLQSGLKATGYCIQVSNAAEIYSAVSQKYIMPVISNIGEQIALTPEKAQQKQREIERTLNDMDEGVTELIKNKQDAFHDKMEGQMQKYARNMVKAVKLGNNASTKAVKK